MTFFKVMAALVFVVAIIKLAPLLLTLSLSVLLAASLHPVVEWLERRNFSRTLALGLVICILLSAVILSIVFLIPELMDQLQQVIAIIPKFQKDLLGYFPDGPVHNLLVQFSKNPETIVGGDTTEKMIQVSFFAMDTLLTFGIFLLTAIYLTVDGKGTYKWLSAFFLQENREKIDRTAHELSQVVFAYVGGQAITSGLVGVFTYVVLRIFDVPAALILAVIAALFDLLPVVGFITSVVLIFLLALTVSTSTALSVLGLCVIYHLFENYVLIPKVYGKRLRLSTLVVFLSFLIAGSLAGVQGAILILPLVAAYPIIERHWLGKYLKRETIREHEVVESRSPSENRQAENA